MLRGYKTLITNVVGVLAAVLGLKGIELTPEQQAEIATGLVAVLGVLNIIVRHFTDSKAAWREGDGPGRKLPLVLLAVLLAGCGSSSGGTAAALLDRLQLEDCEIGYVDFGGTVDVSGTPFVTSNVYIEMHEERTIETLPAHCGSAPSVEPPPGS